MKMILCENHNTRPVLAVIMFTFKGFFSDDSSDNSEDDYE
jgi:hypothetical protein